MTMLPPTATESSATQEPPACQENGAGAEPGLAGDALKSVLESLIFVSERPVPVRQLARAARASIAEVQPLLDELVSDYQHRGVHLYFVAGGYQFRSARENADFVNAFVAPKPLRLTRAQLETLAIVAYRQPITRPEIDDIRGVDSGSALGMLAERGLIKILGRKDEPGRPLLYGTAPEFLEFFGLSSLRELPTLQEFSDLTDESKALFERKTGETIDFAEAEIEAAEAQAAAEEELWAEEHAFEGADGDDEEEGDADMRRGGVDDGEDDG